jgi:hypothetical protein
MKTIVFFGPIPRRKFAQSGVNVMITIFFDFCQFLAQKFALSHKTNVTNKFLQKLAVV